MVKVDTRSIDELGRIVLPAEAREALGWKGRTELDIFYDRNTQELCLKEHVKSCVHCGSSKDLINFNGTSICLSCQKDIAKLSQR